MGAGSGTHVLWQSRKRRQTAEPSLQPLILLSCFLTHGFQDPGSAGPGVSKSCLKPMHGGYFSLEFS